MDSDSDNYFLPIINEDTSNHYITVENLFSGTPSASDRPANFYVTVPKASIGAKTIAFADKMFIVEQYGPSGVGTNDATIATFTFGSEVTRDTLRVTCTNATGPVLAVTSRDKMTTHTFAAITDATPYAADNKSRLVSLTQLVRPYSTNTQTSTVLRSRQTNSRMAKFTLYLNQVQMLKVTSLTRTRQTVFRLQVET